MVNFNKLIRLGNELDYLKDCLDTGHICNSGKYTKLVEEFLEKKLKALKVYLTASGTAALEMGCMLAGIGYGDEVIVPSFTFSTSANSIVRCGGIPVFVDIRKDTMNLDENKIEAAITSKTKAIMVVHYAGVGCNMEKIMEIAKKYHLLVIEDAAQCVNAIYHDKYLGTIGDIGCFSFHETKNYAMGEGGAILINREELLEKAAIIRACGTDRIKFINGQVDKYTWVESGSSFYPSDLLAAYLYPQLLKFDEINEDRVNSFYAYYKLLEPLKNEGYIELPYVPDECEINGHMFYIKVKDIKERELLQKNLRNNDIETAFHYIPLHSSAAGVRFGRFDGEDINTTKESERLLRLPMYYGLTKEDISKVCKAITSFYKGER